MVTRQIFVFFPDQPMVYSLVNRANSIFHWGLENATIKLAATAVDFHTLFGNQHGDRCPRCGTDEQTNQQYSTGVFRATGTFLFTAAVVLEWPAESRANSRATAWLQTARILWGRDPSREKHEVRLHVAGVSRSIQVCGGDRR